MEKFRRRLNVEGLGGLDLDGGRIGMVSLRIFGVGWVGFFVSVEVIVASMSICESVIRY